MELATLQQLLQRNDIETKYVSMPPQEGQMGLEDILIVLISSAIIPSLLSTIDTWLSNRKQDFTFIDKNSGKEIHISSQNGFSDIKLQPPLKIIKEYKFTFLTDSVTEKIYKNHVIKTGGK